MKKVEEIKNFLESKETYNLVYNILNELTPLTSLKKNDLFISGGSVSNILYHLLYGGKLKINDIDVYRFNVDKQKDGMEKVMNEWYNIETSIEMGGLQEVEDSYGNLFIEREKYLGFKIIKHERKEILNLIDYTMFNLNPGDLEDPNFCRNSIVLKSFDLNCCKSGIDLMNEKLLYTEEFINFLVSKQISVIEPNSVIQTSIRIFKKLQDLEGTYCNIPHEIRFLIAFSNYNNRKKNRMFGNETYLKYLKYRKSLDEYFNIEKTKDSFWTFSVKPEKDFTIFEKSDNIGSFKNMWYLNYTIKSKGEQNKINKIFYKNVLLNKLDKSRETYGSFNYRTKTESPFYSSNRFTFRKLVKNINYHKCDFSIKHVGVIDDFIWEHPGMTTIFMNPGTLKDDYNLVKFLKSMTKNGNEWVIGLIESNYKLCKHLAQYSKDFKELKEKILEESQKEIEKLNIPLVDKIDLKGFSYKENVTELVTPLDLKKEGYKMGHCVGGYSFTIENKYSRIFNIKNNGIESTVEIKIPRFNYIGDDVFNVKEGINFKEIDYITKIDDKKVTLHLKNGKTIKDDKNNCVFSVKQHYGRYPEKKGNQKPTFENQMIVEKLVEFLNKEKLPNNLKIIEYYLVHE